MTKEQLTVLNKIFSNFQSRPNRPLTLKERYGEVEKDKIVELRERIINESLKEIRNNKSLYKNHKSKELNINSNPNRSTKTYTGENLSPILSESSGFEIMLSNYNINYSPRNLPSEWNLSKFIDNWPILNQCGTGSCVGFAIADGLFNFFAAKNLNNRRNAVSSFQSNSFTPLAIPIRYSPTFLWFFGKELDWFSPSPLGSTIDYEMGNSLTITLHGSMKYASALKQSQFIDLELFSPYLLKTIKDIRVQAKNEFLAGRLGGHAVLIYANCTLFGNLDFNVLKRWLYLNGPVIVDLHVDKNFTINKLKKQAYLTKYIKNDAINSHAITIVGWKIENKTEYFICKNSWGIDCGDRGYIYISKPYLEKATQIIYTIISN